MTVIDTPRLKLHLISLHLFDALLSGDRARAERETALKIPDDLFNDRAFLRMRRDQLIADPNYSPWCPRMIVLKETNAVVGLIGFHAAPDSPELNEIAPGGIEFGYRIYTEHRGNGYASEAVHGLMQWAVRDMGITSFVLSIAPDNAPSQTIARDLGFVKVGEQIDEVDGLEEVLLLDAEGVKQNFK